MNTKLFLASASIFLISFGHAQAQEVTFPTDPTTGKIFFTEIINVDSVLKGDLFNRASTWFVKAFNSSKDVIQSSDREAGVIVGKALILHYMTGMMGENIGDPAKIRYTITISTKDGKYKYEITDFMFHDSIKDIELGSAKSPKDGYTKKYWIKAKQRCLDETNALILSLHAAMKKSSDW